MRLTLHVTERCNLRCTYCYAGCTESTDSAYDMPVPVALAAVDLAAAMSTTDLRLCFLGGEPTLRPDLLEAVAEHATAVCGERGLRLQLELTTNGTIVTGRLLRFLRGHPVVLAVSVDGAAEAHDTHRLRVDGKGAFALTDRNLDRLLRAVPRASASAVFTPSTLPRLAESVDFLLDGGFRSVVTTPDSSARWTDEDVAELRRQLVWIARSYVERTLRGEAFYLGTLDGPIRTHIRGDAAGGLHCEAGVGHLAVGIDGGLFPCMQFLSRDPASPWRLGDVWTGVRRTYAQALQEQSDPGCGDCDLKGRCATGCACANLAATGRPDRIAPIRCALSQAATEVADATAAFLTKKRAPAFLHKHYNRLYPVALRVEDEVFRQEPCHV